MCDGTQAFAPRGAVGDEVRDRRRRFARNATSGRQRLAQKAIAVGPNAPEGVWTFSLTLGYYRRGRRFADRVFADWRFTDWPLTNWRGLDNRLRMGEVRSNRRSHQSQRCSANYYEFQHEVPYCH